MDVDVDNLVVEHNEAAERFQVQVHDLLAVAEYKLDSGTIIFTHTQVPKPLSGHGVADKMVHAALEHARAKQLSVVRFCPFVAAYIRRHSDYKDLVHSDYRALVL